jgi:hypothetical protein
MRCYVITETRAMVYAREPKSLSVGATVVRTAKDLDQKRFPTPRLVAIWNTLPGVESVKRFTSRPSGVSRVWAALEKLPVSTGRNSSKQAKLIAMLQRPRGASMEELVSATGWQRHSLRGLLSGVVRKKLGLEVALVKDGNRRAYQIAR